LIVSFSKFAIVPSTRLHWMFHRKLPKTQTRQPNRLARPQAHNSSGEVYFMTIMRRDWR